MARVTGPSILYLRVALAFSGATRRLGLPSRPFFTFRVALAFPQSDSTARVSELSVTRSNLEHELIA